MQSTAWAKDLRVTADGTGVVSHVGAVLLRMLADRAGLTQAISGALARRGWWPGHDRGRVLVDLAVMIADGGEAICDIDALRHQGEAARDQGKSRDAPPRKDPGRIAALVARYPNPQAHSGTRAPLAGGPTVHEPKLPRINVGEVGVVKQARHCPTAVDDAVSGLAGPVGDSGGGGRGRRVLARSRPGVPVGGWW